MYTKTNLWKANKKIILNFNTSYRNMCSEANPLTSKTGSVQKKYLIVPYKDLHPELKLPATHIRFQNVGRIGGTLLYPLLSIIGFPIIIFYTPVCVGIHHISIRFAYRAALETFKASNVVVDANLNRQITSKIAAKSLSRFHFNYKGDLVLHIDNSARFSLSKFRGISITEDKKNNNPLSCKLNAIRDRIFPQLKLQISYFHLEEDVQKQVKQVLTARQLRFRACMGTIIAGSILGSGCDLFLNLRVDLHLYILLGLIIHSSNSSDFMVAKHTDDLWNLIRQKKELVNIIKPQHRKSYQISDFNKDLHLNISTFGNIQYHNQKPVSFRKTCLLKYAPKDDKPK